MTTSSALMDAPTNPHHGASVPTSDSTAVLASSSIMSAAEATRLMPPPSAVFASFNSSSSSSSSSSCSNSSSNRGRVGQRSGGGGRGRGKAGRPPGKQKRRGPGRPPNSERLGTPTGSPSEIRRGPGRPPGKRKKLGLGEIATAKPKRSATKRADSKDGDYVHNDVDPPLEQRKPCDLPGSSGYETDPEITLNVSEGKVSTVHWDPTEGSKVGWKVRLMSGPAVRDGRITQYDPYSHKHKIELDVDEENCFEDYNVQKKKRQHKKPTSVWLRLRHADTQIATRLVWAHVKGYAWWPAMVMELSSSNSSMASPREGYVFVHFIGAPEVATLRDSPDCIRPFSSLVSDPIIEKSKKKRNAKAISQAQEEEVQLQRYKNQAARHLARKAFALADPVHRYVGKRVKLFSNDISYPDGATVIGTVRRYSSFQKKWLVSFEFSCKVKHKTSAGWINLKAKDCSLAILQDESNKPRKAGKTQEVDPTDIDLVTFLAGFEYKISDSAATKKGSKKNDDEENKHTDGSCEADSKVVNDAVLAQLLKERCRGCVDSWSGEHTVQCDDCGGMYHLGCVDPPIGMETYQRMSKDAKGTVVGWKCPSCTLCLGCYQKDTVFGSHPLHPFPPTVSFPPGYQLNLCSMCVKAYEADKYCPNCAHAWDDVKYQKVLDQLDEDEVGPPQEAAPAKKLRPSKDGDSPELEESSSDQMRTGMPANTPFADGTLLNGARVDPSWYHAENNVWGYTEGDMLVCDGCDLWVHAGCGGLSQQEYELTSEGSHPVYSKEFLCRVCCRKRCMDIIDRLRREDVMMLFAVPVTEKVAPNYNDLIKHPMDLQTMMRKAKHEEYLNYAWVRQDFSLMVFNALTFNRFYTKFWNEAKRFYEECLKVVFSPNEVAKAAPACPYDDAIQKNFVDAEAARKMEEDRIQQDESTEKKDLVAGTEVTKVTLPPLCQKAPDETSCLPFQEVKVKPVDAYFFSWMDCCFTCGSSGAADTMIFCVDCGEAFHSFCANVPIHSMDADSVAGWRCPNCKICEISGDVPVDELRMLFCEMCDRAFSLDLLDPPLRKAPSGLWICGQCVDCKVCHNKSEPEKPGNGSSFAKSAICLKYWSGDPEKCFRCGGCDGMADLIVWDKMECQLCKQLLRSSDENFVKCSDCKARVHAGCDKRADDCIQQQRTEELFGTRTLKAQKGKAEYKCPDCAGIKVLTIMEDVNADMTEKTNHAVQAWQTTVQGGLQCDNYPPLELHGKLLDRMDWQTLEMFRDKYVEVVEEALYFCGVAKASFDDPRIMIQGVVNGKIDLPVWMGHRASRFLVLAKRCKWDTVGFLPKGIEGCVSAAKLASAFIGVACHELNLGMMDNIKSFDRVEFLLKAPGSEGVFEISMDEVRCKNQENVCEKEGTKGHPASVPARTSSNILASPLCGWGRHVDPSSTDHAWRDSRECCLCHFCGDDDAGFPEPVVIDPTSNLTVGSPAKPHGNSAVAASEPTLDERAQNAKSSGLEQLGRLLPMSEGLWVHSSCASWSSEVWESPRGGLVNAMEKARSRGAQLKCFGCGRPGATVGCNKQNCSFNYHFPCAKACGAVFTSKQQMFCANHKSYAHQDTIRGSYEVMKTLVVAPEKQKPLVTVSEKDAPGESNELCFRVGSLTVHSLGKIVQDVDGFHAEDYVYPEGYVATRIFWSMISPRTRTIYVLKVERSHGSNGATGPLFTITPGDSPSSKIRGRFAYQAYKTLVDRVKKVNGKFFSQGDLYSKLPMIRKSRKKFFALNGPQFFGFGLNLIRGRLECLPGIEAVVAPLKPTSPRYRFCFVQPNIDSIVDLQRKRAAVAAERALENSSGCARTEGRVAVARSGGSGRITRALVRSVEEDGLEEANASSSAGNRRKNTDPEKNKLDKKSHQMKYNRMKAVPMEDHLVARRSHIHGWGLFTKLDIKKDNMITEYMGEIVRQCIADKRESAYEISGEGSCYMFRLDLSRIVDATVVGCMARFMNHCCQPNAYAKIITVDTEFGIDKKIAVFANRDISAGEEITYDYKFPVEDGSLRCTCGAPNCIGRMN